MSNLSIKDVPEEWAEALRLRAARHHRSLQGELLAIVEAVFVEEVQASPESRPQRRPHAKTVEQIALEMRALFSQPVLDTARAVDIIRAERDAR
jgi:plasmid stability protein